MKKLIDRFKNNKIIKNYIWVFAGQNLGTLFSMLTLIFTLRIISTYDYGSLVIIQTYCLLVSNLFSLRTFNGVIKHITDAEQTDDNIRICQYINTGFLLDLLSGTISIIFGILLLKPITYLMEWEIETVRFVNMYLPVVFFYPFLHGTSTGIMRKLGYFFHVNLIHVIVFGLQFMLVFFTWLSQSGSFQLIIIEYMGTEILECLLLLAYSVVILNKHQRYRSFYRAGISRDKEFLKYNVYYGLITTFDQLLSNVSTLLINRFIGNFATAYIKVITRICNLFSKLTNPISQVFYPELCDWVSKKRFKQSLKVSVKYLYIVGGIGTLLIVLMTATFDWWISIFDPSMSSAKIQSLLYMVYTLMSVSIICINQLMFALNLVKQNLVLIIIFDLLYIVCLIPSIKMYDIYGYLILQIIQLLCVVIGKLVFINREIKKLSIDNTDKSR